MQTQINKISKIKKINCPNIIYMVIFDSSVETLKQVGKKKETFNYVYLEKKN